MAERRGRESDLCSGPGRLAAALGIDLSLNGHELSRPPLRLLPGAAVPDDRVRATGRIGVSRASDWPARFFVEGSPAARRPIDFDAAATTIQTLTTLERR